MIPPRGHVTARVRIKNIPYGVDVHLRLHSLGGLTYHTVARHAICGILVGCVREGLDASEIKDVLDEVKEQYYDESTETWSFGSDGDDE